jgi:hypothetical protein
VPAAAQLAPASIFMGDAGACSSASWSAAWRSPPGRRAPGTWPLILPALIALLPIFDTAFVAVHRFVARRPIAQGGIDHVAPPRRRRLLRQAGGRRALRRLGVGRARRRGDGADRSPTPSPSSCSRSGW